MVYLYDLMDGFLEASVFLSFSRIGFWLRKRGWDSPQIEANLAGKTCLVTGANSGLGLLTSEWLARLGARVIMLSRDQERGENARLKVIQSTKNPEVELALVDLSRPEDILAFTRKFVEDGRRLDVLVNNAGLLPSQRRLTERGIEMAFAVNVVGTFLLTEQLLPALQTGDVARVITVSSGGMYTQKLDLKQLQSNRSGFNGTVIYAQTKRAQVILNELWSECYAKTGIKFFAMHPGWVDTPGLKSSLPAFYRFTRPFLRTPAEGADTIVWLASRLQPLDSGLFWHDRRARSTHKTRRTRESVQSRQELWDLCRTKARSWQAEIY